MISLAMTSPRPAAMTTVARFIRFEKPLPDVRQIFFGNAFAGVFNDEFDVLALLPCRHTDRTAFGRMPNGVVQQVGKELLNAVGIEDDRHLKTGCIDLGVHACAPKSAAPSFCTPAG